MVEIDRLTLEDVVGDVSTLAEIDASMTAHSVDPIIDFSIMSTVFNVKHWTVVVQFITKSGVVSTQSYTIETQECIKWPL